MTAPWLLVAPGMLSEGAEVELDPEEGRHLRDVLRGRPGDAVVLADGHGVTARAEIRSCRRSRVLAQAVDVTRAPEPVDPGVTLALGLLHGRAMDWAVQKAVEVGVGRFLPLVCDRSQVSFKAAVARRDHWQRVARQALKQCRRPWGMTVAEPVSIDDLVEESAQGPRLVADPEGMAWIELERSEGATLVVGPEGGLNPHERLRLNESGWIGLCLGPHTLRAETAATIGAAVLVNSATGCR